MSSGSSSPPPPNAFHASILDDASLAPLKRNTACLACKKRKVKCDAIHPTCSPCLRSHAHALRSAQRNHTAPPILSCVYADESDTPERSPPREQPVEKRRHVSGLGSGLGSESGGAKRKGQEARDEEKELLYARIAELEARLAGLTPPSSDASSAGLKTRPSTTSNLTPVHADPAPQWTGQPHQSDGVGSGARVEEICDSRAPPPPQLQPIVPSVSASDWDFGGLFMVPVGWPKNLPSPFLLDHLIETFFNSVPQLPRLLHRATFMTHVRLPPTHPKFPHPGLLHAICAAASSYTAWVNNIPPMALEAAIDRCKETGSDLESIEDFGVAQLESAMRAIKHDVTTCLMKAGVPVFEILQATIIMTEICFTKGMPLQGWLLAGHPARLIKSLELGNKNAPQRHKEPLLPDPIDDVEREERLAAVWMAYALDAGFAINSAWGSSMDISEIRCKLPTSSDEFSKKSDFMLTNPQTAQSPDLYTHHPIKDPFVLLCKAAIILGRVARWLRDWQQRDIIPGDSMTGMRLPSFERHVNDIYAFQASLPMTMKNIYNVLENNGSVAFDANLVMLHILPNIALALLYEPFAEWNDPSSYAVMQIQRAYEAVVGILHLIPSNLDVGLIMNGTLAFSLYTVGRIIVNFVQRAEKMQQFGLVARYRADGATCSGILERYGQKQCLGYMMGQFLNGQMGGDGEPNSCGTITFAPKSPSPEPSSTERTSAMFTSRALDGGYPRTFTSDLPSDGIAELQGVATAGTDPSSGMCSEAWIQNYPPSVPTSSRHGSVSQSTGNTPDNPMLSNPGSTSASSSEPTAPPSTSTYSEPMMFYAMNGLGHVPVPTKTGGFEGNFPSPDFGMGGGAEERSGLTPLSSDGMARGKDTRAGQEGGVSGSLMATMMRETLVTGTGTGPGMPDTMWEWGDAEVHYMAGKEQRLR